MNIAALNTQYEATLDPKKHETNGMIAMIIPIDKMFLTILCIFNICST